MQTITFSFQLDSLLTGSATHLRGFIAAKFPEYELLHQHDNDKGGLKYLYPKIQYKVLDGIPFILGIDEGTDIVKAVAKKIENVKLAGKDYKIINKTVIEKSSTISIIENPSSYSFLTPWLALNEKNYERYQRCGTWAKRKELLEKTLIGNIISMSKSLGYTVPEPIKAEIINLKEVPTSLKGTPMLGFLGTFSVNFEIPDYWGIGKSVSRGFGTVVRQKPVNSNEVKYKRGCISEEGNP